MDEAVVQEGAVQRSAIAAYLIGHDDDLKLWLSDQAAQEEGAVRRAGQRDEPSEARRRDALLL
ncbi:hypothetical protein RZS08_27650, partial [Arthrospira platensis SPKY1]|nr:hypothetical protein [Arthrospira platensis SPKY1]